MAKRRTFISDTTEELKQNTNVIDDSFDENVEAFLRSVRLNQRSEDTIFYYRDKLRNLEKVLSQQGYSTRIRSITEDILSDGYILYSKEEKGLKDTTIRTNLRAFRAFFNWCVKKGVIENSPMKDIKIGGAKTTDIETFTKEQISELFAQPNLSTFVGLRDYVIMGVFLETGIRLRELVDIEINDVRLEDSQILIHGKNGNDRLVPFQAKTAKLLRKYMRIRGRSETDYLFITHDDTKMSRRAVQNRIEKYGRMANIKNVRSSPHTFRHTFAKMSVRNGANVFELQKILGHSSLDMVRVYVNLFSTEVFESHKRFSPMENLNRIR
ncbi:tyrosine-type recombinase/integrase [Oceanobacillus sojae]|uniref:tyrosine-type recombinase/integrase n=1 Tax=Oceanobacillus sojae TaxID=582851 RepID=UPI0009884D17